MNVNSRPLVASESVRGVFPSYDSGSNVPPAELVTAKYALAVLTLRCGSIAYAGVKGLTHVKNIQWVSLATRPVDGRRYLADRRNYLTGSYDQLRRGTWMAVRPVLRDLVSKLIRNSRDVLEVIALRGGHPVLFGLVQGVARVVLEGVHQDRMPVWVGEVERHGVRQRVVHGGSLTGAADNYARSARRLI